MAPYDECDAHTRPESVIVKLTRMEGKLDNLTDKLNDLRPRVNRHGVEISDLCLKVQSLEQGATSEKLKAEALAKALSEAKETAEATTRLEAEKKRQEIQEEEHKAALGWSPVTKVFAVASAFLVVIVIYQAIVGG